jgi:hypothetical protein
MSLRNGGEIRVWEADFGEAIHAHVGIDVLEDALSEEDQSYGDPD